MKNILTATLRRNATPWTLALCCTALIGIACGDDKSNGNGNANGQDAGDNNSGGNGSGDDRDAGDAGTEPEESPVYLYSIAVYGPTDTLQYALLRNELDLNISVDDLNTAHEFPGYTGVAAINGHVITGDSETPFATKWKIGEDLSWSQVGNKLNFGDYFTGDDDGLNFYFQSIKGSDMYFFYGAERTSRVHWNVDEWKIKGDYQDTVLPTRDGWTLANTGNRTGNRDFKGPVAWSFDLNNDETGLYSDESWIAVYDPETHEEKSVIEVPCPGLEQSTQDEDGNLYFATTFNKPTLALYGDAPTACVVKVKADGTLDVSFPSNDLRDWTGGFYGVNFRYVGQGKAVANVLHHDRLTDVDWTGEVDPEVEIKIGGQWTDEGDYLSEDPTLWELHLIDLETGTSKVVEGFKPEHDVSFYTIFFQVDGRTFINVQYDVDSLTNNAIYELNLETARVTSVGQVAGDLWAVERVR